MIQFELDEKEAAFIIQILGQLPTQSGAFFLWQKLQQQMQKQHENVTNKTL